MTSSVDCSGQTLQSSTQSSLSDEQTDGTYRESDRESEKERKRERERCRRSAANHTTPEKLIFLSDYGNENYYTHVLQLLRPNCQVIFVTEYRKKIVSPDEYGVEVWWDRPRTPDS